MAIIPLMWQFLSNKFALFAHELFFAALVSEYLRMLMKNNFMKHKDNKHFNKALPLNLTIVQKKLS